MNKFKDIIIYAADIGSIKAERFGWHRLEVGSTNGITGTCISSFANHISDDISKGHKLCVGFECPLFLETPKDPKALTSARQGEGCRAWSAGAGCGALATGLTEVLWVFNEIAKSVVDKIVPTFSLDDIKSDKSNFLVWEAFVTSKSKGASHCDDAIIAAQEFSKRLISECFITDVQVENPYSLAGAALLRSGLTKEIGILSKQCLVVKA